MSSEPKFIDVEVVEEASGAGRRAEVAHPRHAERSAMEGPPIHPLSALLLLVVDNLWLLPEFLVIDWVITIPLCFITVLIPTVLIQKLIKKQGVGAAVGYSILLGVTAAVPTSLLGTPVGAGMLAWFGISKLWSSSQEKTAP